MATVRLNGENIQDWASFHKECSHACGFPAFYGNNLDAWVDCLSYLRDEDSMTKFRLKPNEILTIEITHSLKISEQVPGMLDELEMCVAFMNERYEEYGEPPALAMVFL